MAQLKDTVVAGDLSVTGTIYGDVPLNNLTDADDLKAIEALTGTSGILTKTAANTWSLSSGAAPASHTHGKITNDGKIANADNVAIANGDRLIISDSSDSYILKNTSITFDGSTETKALTQKGTWATFNNYSHPTGAGNNHIPSGGSSGQFLGWSSAGTAAWVNNPNTDTKVTQAAAITTAGEYPVLLAYSTATTAVTNTVNKTGNLLYNPNTGVLTLGNGTTTTLYAKTPSRTSSFITVGGGIKTAGDVNGTALRIGAGGLTMVGGGEYVGNRYGLADLDDTTESLYLGADNAVFIETNTNTIANRKTFTFNGTGDLIVPTTTTATAKVRNISYGTTAPSGGNNGDVYIQHNSNVGTASASIGEIGKVYYSYWGYVTSAISTTSTYIINTGTVTSLPAGTYLLLMGGPLYTSTQTAQLHLLINGTSYQGCVSNTGNGDHYEFGAKIINIGSALSSVTFQFVLKAQSTASTAYLGAYKTISCVLIRLPAGVAS